MFSNKKMSLKEVVLFSIAALLSLLGDAYISSQYSVAWVNIVAAAIPAILGAVQMGMASRQKKQRPTYDIPSAQKEALENQRRLAAMEKAPGTDAMLNQIRQQGAAAVQNVKEMTGGSAGAAGAATDIYAKELEALQGMQGNQQNFRLQQQGALNQALNAYGEAENKVWDYNVNQPYQQSMAAKSALTNASMSNILGGVTGALGTYGAQQQNKEMMDFYKSLYKNQQIQGGTNTANVAESGFPSNAPAQQNPWFLPVNPNIPIN
jgi:hypothetical protein